jgi:IgGFc binding protein
MGRFSYLLIVLAAACGSNGNRFGDGGSPDATVDVIDDNAFNFNTDGGEGGPCGAMTCSGDLHDVLCGDGTVAQTCPPDQGCAAGVCVPACQAASADKTTIGCEYWTLYPDMYSADEGDCLAVYIANTWGSPVTLAVEYNNSPLTGIAQAAVLPSGSGQAITYTPLPSGQIPADQVAIVFLAGTPTAPVQCPAGITPLMTTDPATHGTGIGKSFHITTSAPVVGYQIYPYGGGNSAITSATLLLPTSVWDTNYVGVDAYNNTGPWLVIMAQQDGTMVSLTPTSAVAAGGGIPAMAANTLATITLNKGQYAQIDEPSGTELNGTPIQSNFPIAVFGGDTCMDVPQSAGACDAAHQQIPPVKALGNEYVGVKYRDRYSGNPETPPWRVIGAVDGTTLTWEPSAPSGAPVSLSAGQMVEFPSGGPFVVKSQDSNHPFYMAQYMTGCTAYWDGSDCRGDPEFVNIIPSQQYLNQYVLFTDPTYPETELVIIREAGAMGFQDVTLDCVGTLTGWQPVGTSGKYEFVRADLVTGNFQKVGSCDNGRHTMSSNGSFGVTVWGWGSAATGGSYRCNTCSGFYSQAVSYAYPAGASVQSINSVVIVPK